MRFKSRGGGHVRIFRPDAPLIDIDEGGVYETSDRAEIEALKASPEVVQDRSKPAKDDKGAEDGDDA